MRPSWSPTTKVDATRSGGASYSRLDLSAFLSAISNGDLTLAEAALASLTGGRAIRQITRDLLEAGVIVAPVNGVLRVCRWRDQAMPYVSSLKAHRDSIEDRIRLAERAMSDLPRRQMLMFADDDFVFDEPFAGDE